jgi:hypothetical protein
MSQMTSSIPAVRKYLTTLFATATASFATPPVKVDVSIALDDSSDDRVIIGGATRHTSAQAIVGGMGYGALKEEYTVDFQVQATLYGANAFPAVDDRAYAILDACEEALRNDPTLGGLVDWAYPSGSKSEHDQDENGSSICDVTGTVEIHNTI